MFFLNFSKIKKKWHNEYLVTKETFSDLNMQ